MADIDIDQAVVIALGSNLKGRYPSCVALLEAAAGAVDSGAGPLAARSSWWRSQAWPDPKAPHYINGVVLIASPRLEPAELLSVLSRIEHDFGRIRGPANAPRSLDLDLIAYGRRQIADPGLIVPHPRAHERRFVMGPLAEVAPGWRHPLTGATAAELAARARICMDATPMN